MPFTPPFSTLIGGRLPYKNKEDKQAWRKKNAKRVAAHSAKYYRTHLGKHAASKAAWTKANPAKDKAYSSSRRTRKTKAGGSFTDVEWNALCNTYGNICLRCKQTKPLTPDHVIPVSKGGTSNIDNIQPLCQSCNSKKHVDTTDYRPWGEKEPTEYVALSPTEK